MAKTAPQPLGGVQRRRSLSADQYTARRPWPWPEDSREDRAKRIAGTYRGLVQRIAQGLCEDPAVDLDRLDQHWCDLGAFWVMPPQAEINEQDWVDVRTAAHYADRSEQTIRVWAHRDLIDAREGADGAPEYRVASLIEYANTQRNQRAARHLGRAG